MLQPQNPTDVLWTRLQAASPAEVVARAAVSYDPARQAYVVPVCGREVTVVPAEKRVEAPEGSPGFEAGLVCLQYLLVSRDVPRANEWVDPKVVPYGDFFFRGPHDLPTAGLERAFGQRLDAFRKAAESLGGRAVQMGDAACEFRALPRVPIVVILWAADDEFPARARFLFDRSVHHQLPVDALWVLCRVLAKGLVASVGSPTGRGA